MNITSGLMKVKENKNKSAKFFKEIEVGDIVEVRVNPNVRLTRQVSDKLFTVHNITQGTSRTDAPIHMNKGLDKLVLEPVPQINEAEYKRGYNEAYSELQSAYFGGYIEELFEEEQ